MKNASFSQRKINCPIARWLFPLACDASIGDTEDAMKGVRSIHVSGAGGAGKYGSTFATSLRTKFISYEKDSCNIYL